ncbi:MAG: hypothetical protein JSV24_05310 [Bacteroidales bacterium]|nr:MAG: hypothetical protein JSV24_05310 [Bacteroidales bacterium]
MKVWSKEAEEIRKILVTIKDQLPDLEKELELLVKTEDDNVALLYSRRCLEVIITDLCEKELKRPRKSDPLKGIIDRLNRVGSVPSHIITSMLNLNSLSTFGTHPKEYNPQMVRPALINLATIIEWYVKYRDSLPSEPAGQVDVDSVVKKPESQQPFPSGRKIRYSASKKKVLFILSGIVTVSIITVLALVLIGRMIRKRDAMDLVKSEKSIAVLPFKNYSGDPGQDYICYGLTDEIINHLFKISSFRKVSSLSSVLTYRETNKRIPEIAKDLKVYYILEGTYKESAEKIRVTAQLINARKDKHIWQNEYDGSLDEIIAIQADIALQIAEHLKLFLTNSETQNIQNIPTSNPEAYLTLQKAKSFIEFNKADQALELAMEAIKLDSTFADAFAYAGWRTLGKGAYAGGSEMQSVFGDALIFYKKALELNPNLAAAHTGLGLINEWVKWDYVLADKGYLKAIELEPNNVASANRYIEFLIKMNRIEDLRVYIEKLKDIGINQSLLVLAQINIISNDRQKAIENIESMLELGGITAQEWIGLCYVWLAEYDSAKVFFQSALRMRDARMQTPRFQASMALVYHETGDIQGANSIISRLTSSANETSAGSPAFFTGLYYSAINMADSAFYWFEKAYENRSPEFPWFKVHPLLRNLKSDERYRYLYERTGHKAFDENTLGSFETF